MGRYADDERARVRVPPELFVHWFRLPDDAPLESLSFTPSAPDPMLDFAVGARWNSRFPGLRCSVCRAQIPTNRKRPARWPLDGPDDPGTTRDWYCLPCAREADDPRIRELGLSAREAPAGCYGFANPWGDAAPRKLRTQPKRRPVPPGLAKELRRIRDDDEAFGDLGARAVPQLLAADNGNRQRFCRRASGRPTRPHMGDLAALAHAGRIDDVRDVLESAFVPMMESVPRLRRHAFAKGVAEGLRAEFSAEELAEVMSASVAAAEATQDAETGAPRADLGA